MKVDKAKENKQGSRRQPKRLKTSAPSASPDQPFFSASASHPQMPCTHDAASASVFAALSAQQQQQQQQHHQQQMQLSPSLYTL
jgi:hypothetical protein